MQGDNEMATASFFKTFGISTQEETDRFIEILSQGPKPIPEDIGKDILDEKSDEGKELLKRLLSR
jgi:hypothetical protein